MLDASGDSLAGPPTHPASGPTIDEVIVGSLTRQSIGLMV